MSSTESAPDLQDETERARRVKKNHEAQLMAKANVVGVGVGLCKTGGIQTGRVGLVVMVSQKLPRSSLSPDDLLPREIDGVPVDVQEVGLLRAH